MTRPMDILHERFQDIFEVLGTTTYTNSQIITPKKYYEPTTTKSSSYSVLNMGAIDTIVYNTIKVNIGITRNQLVTLVKKPINTISGAVTRLLTNEFIHVLGMTQDENSGREVQMLCVIRKGD